MNTVDIYVAPNVWYVIHSACTSNFVELVTSQNLFAESLNSHHGGSRQILVVKKNYASLFFP